MTQKQHVDYQRKIKLRQTLIEKAGILTGAYYIPFIGEGDIAVELYSSNKIYGADIEPAMVEKARSRLPDAEIIAADCDEYPFNKDIATIVLADFDAYSYPYDSFRSFFKGANIGSQCVLFFTDGQRQAIIRTGHYHRPDGEKIIAKTKTEKREAYNFYFNKIVLPWFKDYIKPWTIVYITKYLRKNFMCYWGAIIAGDTASNKNTCSTIGKPYQSSQGKVSNDETGKDTPGNDETNIDKVSKVEIKPYKFDDIKKAKYLEHISNGHTRGYAATLVGISRATVCDHMKKDKAFAEAISEAEGDAIAKVENALHEAAVSGNVTAIQVYLYNRDPRRWSDKRNIRLTGEGGGPLKIEHGAKDKILKLLERLAISKEKDSQPASA